MSDTKRSLTEQMFSVTLTVGFHAWGDDLTATILNPDGSVCVSETWRCGPDGFTNAQEGDVAEWIGEEAKEFISTYFSAAAEQSQQCHDWR